MTSAIAGYAAKSSATPIEPFSFTRREPRETDVVIDILYCGVCHTDIHMARNEWGGSIYPIVPGHEIIGRVAGTGSSVTAFASGNLVGVGCMVDSCRECQACAEGLEQYCENGMTLTYNDKDRHDGLITYGGYSERIVVDQDFVLRVPEGLDPRAAAPLLCAGITTWSPLRHWKIGPGSKVAIIGLGGLGHMGIKFAKAFGAEVALFTRSPGKADEARRLGAGEVILSTDKEQMKKARGRFDFILDTVPNPHDINPYLRTLKRDGTLCLVGQLQPLEPPLQCGAIISGRKAVAGSVIGGIAETQEMLDFCAQNGIACDIEMIDIQAINEAYERMVRSDVKYRFVIDMASLKRD